MSGQGWLCAICTYRPATSFCTCEGRETFLCESCFSSHYQKASLLPHLMLPLASYGQHKTPGYIDRLQVRTANLKTAKAEVYKNIEDIDKCISEVSSGIDTIISEVRKYGDSELAKLRDIRTEFEQKINTAITEVESSLYEDTFTFENQWANDIRSYDGDAESLKFFNFGVKTSTVLASLASFCEYTTEARSNFILPGISGNTLKLYNIKTQETQALPLTMNFSSGKCVCFISNQEVLIVGSDPPTSTACIINTSRPQEYEIQTMNKARKYPGLIVVDRDAYVFGGFCRECEKLKLTNKTWSVLPSMSSLKFAFSPCRVKDEIYLIDVSCSSYDVFNLLSQQFQPLQLTVTNLVSNSLSVLVDDKIAIITCNWDFGFYKPGELIIEGSKISGTEEAPISHTSQFL